MKRNLIGLLVLSTLLFSSCLSFSPKPDGVNNTLIYGYMDRSAIQDGYVQVEIIPWDAEYEKVTRLNMKGEMYSLKGVGDFDEMHYVSPVSNDVFFNQNYEPGYYYIGLIEYLVGNKTTYIKVPKPASKDKAIHVEKDQLIYLGAFTLNYDFSVDVNKKVDETQAKAHLLKVFEKTGWKDFIQSH